MPSQDDLKRQAAERAVELVASGMVVGLGGGSTAFFAMRRLAQLLREGVVRDVVGVPCGLQVAVDAQAMGMPLTTLEDHPSVDLTIDGADEVDPQLRLIKGGGGALLREKIVAQVSRREVIVVDASKVSDRLGSRHAIPVEVESFGWRTQVAYLESVGTRPTLRVDAVGEPVLTDQGGYLLDCAVDPLDDPAALARRLEGRAGIIAHGLFIGLATDLIVASAGGLEHRLAEGTA